MEILLLINRYVFIITTIIWGGVSITFTLFFLPLLEKKTTAEVRGLIFNFYRSYRIIMYGCWALLTGTFTIGISINKVLPEEIFFTPGIFISIAIFLIHIGWTLTIFKIMKQNEYNPLSMTERDVKRVIGGSYFNIFLIFSTVLILATMIHPI
ncbi:hypothetical protein [Kosmotoga olearia]|uniref:DUF4149 domain-containing protein n=1 Tax=Kosmotoga olearia (strain ATCC BAA-1733 / DSM 21960 / TBF 19.5.1) TaxID=521045 RepID=C5CIK3_KOSOT|nr:hypothetical protein [Kosmotoga olearia]ACR79866.1 hypothetical protein Kole_1166 [Kosmotoga olearia TBF 19.5.1]